MRKLGVVLAVSAGVMAVMMPFWVAGKRPEARGGQKSGNGMRLSDEGAGLSADNRRLVIANYGKLPRGFEANRGQTDPQVKFTSRGSGYRLFLTDNEAVLVLSRSQNNSAGLEKPGTQERKAARSIALRIKFAGANRKPHVEALEQLPGKTNFLIGNNPKDWQRNISTYAKVKYEAIYPGVDLVFHGSQEKLEYDFIVAPGADPGKIRMRLQGADRIEVDAAGDLVLHTAAGEVREHKPVLYQEAGGKRESISGKYVLLGPQEAGFAVDRYDAHQTLTIDPVLSYSTYLGGSNDDFGNAIALDASGAVYIAGQTNSIDFPAPAGVLQSSFQGGSEDAFVTKLDTTKSGAASLIYSTYLGGNSTDRAFGIAVDKLTGAAYVSGDTSSTNFPVLHAFDTTLSGPTDAFVSKLDPTGSMLLYSTYLGGSANDSAFAIAADSAGSAYITGSTEGGFPTTANALQRTAPGLLGNAFVSRIDTTLSGAASLVYSTYLGGSDGGSDGFGIAADASHHAYLTGRTFATNFPTTANAFQPALSPITPGGSGYDAFMTKLDTSQAGAASLIYSTYLGGGNEDDGNAIAIEPGCGGAAPAPACNVYVGGATLSFNFPTKDAFETKTLSAQQAFVTKFDKNGAVTYSTYLGGSSLNFGFAIAADTAGNAYVTGRTDATDFPIFRAFQMTAGGGSGDAFVTKFDPAGKISYSSYLGGNGRDRGFGIAVNGAANPDVFVTGLVDSTNFPTSTGALQSQPKGGFEAYLTKIDDSAPDFGLEASDGSLTASASAVRGSTATFNLQVVPFNGFNGTVTLSCAGAPAKTTCTIPASVNSSNYQFAVTVQTTPRGGSMPGWPSVRRFLPQPGVPLALRWMLAVLTVLATVLAWRLRRARLRFAVPIIGILLGVILATAGCMAGAGAGGGGGGGGGGGTIPGIYPLTITANGGAPSVTRTMNLSLSVTP